LCPVLRVWDDKLTVTDDANRTAAAASANGAALVIGAHSSAADRCRACPDTEVRSPPDVDVRKVSGPGTAVERDVLCRALAMPLEKAEEVAVPDANVRNESTVAR
jgi:hypothetical protein